MGEIIEFQAKNGGNGPERLAEEIEKVRLIGDYNRFERGRNDDVIQIRIRMAEQGLTKAQLQWVNLLEMGIRSALGWLGTGRYYRWTVEDDYVVHYIYGRDATDQIVNAVISLFDDYGLSSDRTEVHSLFKGRVEWRREDPLESQNPI